MSELSTNVGRLQTAVLPHPQPNRFQKHALKNSVRQMAESIMARYGQDAAFWQPLSPVLREGRAWQTDVTHQHYFNNQAHFHPRLNLVLVQQTPHHRTDSETLGPSDLGSAPHWQPKRPVKGEQQMATLVKRLQRYETTQRNDVQVMTKRLFKQHQPLDMLSYQVKQTVLEMSEAEEKDRKRPLPNQMSQSASDQIVPRILRKQNPSTETELSSTNHNNQNNVTESKTAPFAVSNLKTSTMDKTTTAVDTNQLADQVMQKLENRLQAHRERTGRI